MVRSLTELRTNSTNSTALKHISQENFNASQYHIPQDGHTEYLHCLQSGMMGIELFFSSYQLCYMLCCCCGRVESAAMQLATATATHNYDIFSHQQDYHN